MTRLAPLAAGLFLVLSLLAACAPGGDSRPVNTSETLVGRPALPEVTNTYERMFAELRHTLEPLLGADGWDRLALGAPSALCQDFGREHDTGVAFLPMLTSERVVAERDWARATAIIEDVTSRYGFSPPTTVVVRPDEYRFVLDDRYGAVLTVQNGPRFLDMNLATGCHLRLQTPQPWTPE